MDADRIVEKMEKPDRLKNWLTGQFSLDSPDQDFFSLETAGDTALGLVPGLTLPTAARDYNIKPENLEKIPRSKYGALPPTETQEFNAYTSGFRNKPDNMGGVRVTVAEGEQPYSGMSYIHRNWRGQGIASNIYDEIEKSYGKMKPSIHLSEAGQRLWAKRDPAALYKSMESELEDLPEQMHFSGDWVKEGLDRFLDKYRAPEIVPLKNDVYDETIKKLRDKGFKFSWEE
jgi:hypothetical protein